MPYRNRNRQEKLELARWARLLFREWAGRDRAGRWGTSVGARHSFARAGTKRAAAGREFGNAGVPRPGNPDAIHQNQAGTQSPEFRKGRYFWIVKNG